MRRIDWFAVTVLLLFAAGLRIIGISYGQLNPAYFPSTAPFGMAHEQLPVHPDEFYSVAIPVNMALRNRLNPEFFNYPSFIINTNFVLNYLTGALEGLSLADRDGLSLRNYAGFPLYVMSRMYSVFGGLLMVACAYAISRIVGGRYVALCAGLLVATSFTLVTFAHYVKPSTPATAWMMVAMWGCIAALYSRRDTWRKRLYILAGITTGLAASTLYNGIAVAIIVVPVGLILLYRFRTRQMMAVISIAWLAIPFFFVLASPYTLRDFNHFWHDFSTIIAQYKVPGQVHEYFTVDQWTGLVYPLAYSALFASGFPAVIFMGLSFIAGWQGRHEGQLLKHNSLLLFVGLTGLMILAYALVALRTVRPGHSEQLLIQALPFMALLSAVGAGWLVKRIALSPRLLMPIVILVLIVQPLVLSVQVVKMFAQPDTRHIMLAWIHQHIPVGSRFFVNGPYNVPLDPAIYPNVQQFVEYAATLPFGEEHDYMIYSDALAYDVLRSSAIVPKNGFSKNMTI